MVKFDEAGIPSECATMFASPPGRQTVNRAEIYSLILGGEASSSELTAYTDSSYAIKAISAGHTNTSNADLVEDAINSIPNTHLVKTKAHAEDKGKTLDQVREWVSWKPYCLNVLADAVADAAADISAPKHFARLWNLWDARVTKIALRLS